MSAPDLFGSFYRAINGSEATPYFWLAAFVVVFGAWPLIRHRFEQVRWPGGAVGIPGGRDHRSRRRSAASAYTFLPCWIVTFSPDIVSAVSN
jgi:hypothetical protein